MPAPGGTAFDPPSREPMADYLPRRDSGHARSGALRKFQPLIVLGGVTLVVGILYLARDILIPLAIATMLTFMLTPVVSALQRRGLALSIAVLLVVVMAFSALGGVAWILADQVRGLAEELPKYRSNIRQKAAD